MLQVLLMSISILILNSLLVWHIKQEHCPSYDHTAAQLLKMFAAAACSYY